MMDKPNNESLDAYVESIERGIMIVNDYREKKGFLGNKSEVINLGRIVGEPYLRIFDYDSSNVDVRTLQGVLRSVAGEEHNAQIEVNLHKAHTVANTLEKALERVYSGSADSRMLKNNLRYYREGLASGVYTFDASDGVLANVLYRFANCSLYGATRNAGGLKSLLQTKIKLPNRQKSSKQPPVVIRSSEKKGFFAQAKRYIAVKRIVMRYGNTSRTVDCLNSYFATEKRLEFERSTALALRDAYQRQTAETVRVIFNN